jgi:hypothetical protein
MILIDGCWSPIKIREAGPAKGLCFIAEIGLFHDDFTACCLSPVAITLVILPHVAKKIRPS